MASIFPLQAREPLRLDNSAQRCLVWCRAELLEGLLNHLIIDDSEGYLGEVVSIVCLSLPPQTFSTHPYTGTFVTTLKSST